MTTEYKRILPAPDEMTQEFWDAAKQHTLVIRRCKDCGTYQHPPRYFCAKCYGSNLSWEKVSGRGKIYSYYIQQDGQVAPFADITPYNVVTVELEEQPGLIYLSNLVDCPNDQIKIDMPVEVTFDDVTSEITLPKFRPAQR